MTSMPASRPARTTARMAAFIPGASPPLVNTAMRFIGSFFVGAGWPGSPDESLF